MATQPLPNSDNLVVVFNSMDESEVLVVKSLLEGEDIECLMTGEVPMETLPGVGGWVLQVPAEQADDARRLIQAERRQPLAADIEFNEDATPEEKA
jgi:Putative prokaryotic signal transducing protein